MIPVIYDEANPFATAEDEMPEDPFSDLDLSDLELLSDEEILIATRQIRLDLTKKLFTDGTSHGTLNSVGFTFPSVPSLLTALTMNGTDLKTNPVVYGPSTNPFVLDYNAVTEVLVVNDMGQPTAFHLHGHAFQVIDIKSTPYLPNNVTIPDAAIRRDTIEVPANGYAILRFENTNPGVWLFHSTVEWQRIAGVMATFIEAPTQLSNITLDSQYNATCAAQNIKMAGNAAGNPGTDLSGYQWGTGLAPIGMTPAFWRAVMGCVVAAVVMLGSVVLFHVQDQVAVDALEGTLVGKVVFGGVGKKLNQNTFHLRTPHQQHIQTMNNTLRFPEYLLSEILPSIIYDRKALTETRLVSRSRLFHSTPIIFGKISLTLDDMDAYLNLINFWSQFQDPSEHDDKKRLNMESTLIKACLLFDSPLWRSDDDPRENYRFQPQLYNNDIVHLALRTYEIPKSIALADPIFFLNLKSFRLSGFLADFERYAAKVVGKMINISHLTLHILGCISYHRVKQIPNFLRNLGSSTPADDFLSFSSPSPVPNTTTTNTTTSVTASSTSSFNSGNSNSGGGVDSKRSSLLSFGSFGQSQSTNEKNNTTTATTKTSTFSTSRWSLTSSSSPSSRSNSNGNINVNTATIEPSTPTVVASPRTTTFGSLTRNNSRSVKDESKASDSPSSGNNTPTTNYRMALPQIPMPASPSVSKANVNMSSPATPTTTTTAGKSVGRSSPPLSVLSNGTSKPVASGIGIHGGSAAAAAAVAS
ncbi:hypothetical protein HDU76_005345, partial [Blyttiomyces sp. JEL0837]